MIQKQKTTSDDLAHLISLKYSRDAYAVFFEVPNGTGMGKSRSCVKGITNQLTNWDASIGKCLESLEKESIE